MSTALMKIDYLCRSRVPKMLAAGAHGQPGRRLYGWLASKQYSLLLAVLPAIVLASCLDTSTVAEVQRRKKGSDADIKTVAGAMSAGSHRKLRFVVIGDFGTGSHAQHAIARRMCKWRRKHPFDLVVTTGDNIYPDGSKKRFARGFFRPYVCLLDRGVRFRASLGNHDYLTRRGRPELKEPAFGMRARNYVVRRRGVRLVIVDANHLRMKWLRRETRPEAGDRWTVVAFHHPVYSPGPHGSTPGFRPALPRLFRRRGVDLVLNGHDHLYSVSKDLRGIRYVVTGGGGAPLYDCSRPWFTRRCKERFHFLYVVAGRRFLRVAAVPRRGPAFHRFRTVGRR